MRNAGLDEAQAGIKIARRNTNNLRYADNTTLMAESGEELKSLLKKVKEESGKPGLKFSIQGTSLVVQWLRLCTPKAEGLGLIPGQGTRSHIAQLRPGTNKEMNIFFFSFFIKGDQGTMEFKC